MLVNNRGPKKHKHLWEWLRPDYLATTVADIDFAHLQTQGIKAIFIDLDGTVVERRTYVVSDSIKEALRSQPLDVYIATNRPKGRDLKTLKEDVCAIGVVHPSGLLAKPFAKFFHRALRAHGLRPEEVIMIGDRYLQDVIGANGAGLRTILVRRLGSPINRSDSVISAIEDSRSERLTRHYIPVD